MDIFLETLMGFLIGAVLVETLTKIIGEKFLKMDKVALSMIMGILVAFYGRFNILELVGLTYGWSGNITMDYIGLVIGIIFSGLVLSTGSNGVHNLLSKLQSAKELTQAKTEIAKIEAETFTAITDTTAEDLRE